MSQVPPRRQDFCEQPVLDPDAEVCDPRVVTEEDIAALCRLPFALALTERIGLVDQRAYPRSKCLLLPVAGLQPLGRVPEGAPDLRLVRCTAL